MNILDIVGVILKIKLTWITVQFISSVFLHLKRIPVKYILQVKIYFQNNKTISIVSVE